MVDPQSLLVILAIAVIAPILADRLPSLRPPSVVVEILLGILAGPQLLGWAHADGMIEQLSRFGLISLFFHLGLEIDFGRIWGRPLGMALGSWIVLLILSLGTAALLKRIGAIDSISMIAVAFTTTALGTLMPILRDSGELGTPFGDHTMAIGAIGEFAPIVMISVVLSVGGRGSMHAVVLLLSLVAITVLGAAIASRARPPYAVEVLHRMMNSSAQLPVRVAMLTVATLVLLTRQLGLDAILGAVAGGIIISAGARGTAREEFARKLEGIGFGLFIPIFFVVTGINFDLHSLLTSPAALIRLPLFLIAFLALRAPVLLFYRRILPVPRDRIALALLSAAGLPLIVAITELGRKTGHMRPENAAALVGAGMASVLISRRPHRSYGEAEIAAFHQTRHERSPQGVFSFRRVLF